MTAPSSRKKILICLANPSAESLCSSLAESYARGAQRAGHEVHWLRLHDLQFDPILRNAYKTPQALEPDLEMAQKEILWCEHFVIFSPVWWGQLPALAKGFVDRCFLPDFAFRFQENGLPEGLLGPRTAHFILSMGAPYLIYRFKFRKCLDRALSETIFKFCGFRKVNATHIANVDELHQSEIDEYLGELEDKGFEGV